MAKELDSTKKSHHIYYFDILRCIACLCVVVLHSSVDYVIRDFGSFNFWVGNIADSLVRVGVPLFVMISGALLLDENYNCSFKKIFNHVTKMIVFFAFWSFLYCLAFQVVLPLIKGEEVSVISCIFSIIEGHYHLWFVYMIIGLYLVTPLIRLWVKKENSKYIEYFFILALVFAFLIPQLIQLGGYIYEPLNRFKNVLSDLGLQYVGGYTMYFILGWYLHNFEFKKIKLLCLFGILGYFISAFGTYGLSVYKNESVIFYDNLSLHVMVSATMVFILVKNKFKYRTESVTVVSKFVKFVANNSLGVYAMHAGIIYLVYKICSLLGLNNALLVIPIAFVTSAGISLICSMIFKKLPILKKVV